MRRILSSIIVSLVLIWPQTFVASNEEADFRRALTASIDFATKLAREKIIIYSVEEQNAALIPLEEVKEDDRGWRRDPSDNNPLVYFITHNGLATVLKDKINRFGRYVSEIMITDNQGALVAAYPKTTDYWQGDEEQWINSFNNGDGRIHIMDIAYDESTKERTSKIGVPILDSENATIGVLIVGIKQSYIDRGRRE